MRSKTFLAVEKAVQFAREYDPGIEAVVLNLADFQQQFCDGRAPHLYEGDTKILIDQIVSADAFIIGTPVYRGSITGVLKNLFDVIPNDALRGKVIGFIATGGTYHHFLAIEHQLHPIAGYFSAFVVPGGVYAHNDHYADGELTSPEIIGRLKALGESVVEIRRKLGAEFLGVEKPLIPRKSL